MDQSIERALHAPSQSRPTNLSHLAGVVNFVAVESLTKQQTSTSFNKIAATH